MKKVNQIKTILPIILGCSKNIADSEYLLGNLQEQGFSIVHSSKEADCIIINTCGFINSSKEESIQMIFQAVNMKRVDNVKSVIVFGCLSQRYQNDLKKQIKGVDAFFGVDEFNQIINYLKNQNIDLNNSRFAVTPTHYSYLKISDGCDHKCSYCAIPLIKGKHKSKSIEAILEEAELHSAQGVKEINIIGQDTTYYGVDIYKQRKIDELLQKIQKLDKFEWIRLLYTYPNGFPDKLISTIAENPNICNYIDIPLQHINDEVLKSMNRKIKKQQITNLLDKLKNEIPGIALRTTFIVGYPTETKKHFNELLKFIKEYKFDRVGAFAYSFEENTPAHKLGDKISQMEKEERLEELMITQGNISYELNRNKIGKKYKLLIDYADELKYVKNKDIRMAAYNQKYIYLCRSEFDAPEIDNINYILSDKEFTAGDFIYATIKEASMYDLIGIAD